MIVVVNGMGMDITAILKADFFLKAHRLMDD